MKYSKRPTRARETRRSAGRSRKGKPESSSRRKPSITPPLLNHQVGSWQNPVAENFLRARREVRPFPGSRYRLAGRDNAGDDAVAFPKFHGVSRAQPALEATGIPELA